MGGVVTVYHTSKISLVILGILKVDDLDSRMDFCPDSKHVLAAAATVGRLGLCGESSHAGTGSRAAVYDHAFYQIIIHHR